MKLMTDDRCRLQSRELLKPNTPYDGQVAPDGAVRLVELVAKEAPVVRPRKVNGRLTGATVKVDRAKLAAAIRADRDRR